MDLLDEQAHRLIAIERRTPREHLEQQRPDRIDVARRTDRIPLRAFGGDVARGPEDEPCGRRDRLLAPVDPSDAEVEHLDVVGIRAAPHEHHVLGLEIAMDDPLGVSLAGRFAELERDVERTVQRQRSTGGRQRALEGEPVEVLHHHVERTVGELAGEEHLDDVRMLEARSDLRLTREAGDELRVRGELAMKDLDRDVAIDAALEGAVHASHRADPDELPDLDVPGDLLPEVRVGGVSLGCGGALERGPVRRAEQRVARVAPTTRCAHLRRHRRHVHRHVHILPFLPPEGSFPGHRDHGQGLDVPPPIGRRRARSDRLTTTAPTSSSLTALLSVRHRLAVVRT